MSASYGPTVNRQGLVYFLDFANPKCYPGTGSSTTDLMSISPGQTISATFSSSNFGTFDMDGANSYLINSVNLSSHFSPSTTVSLFAWVYPTAYGQIVSELGQMQPNAGWHDAQIQITSAGNFYFGVWPHGAGVQSSGTYSFSNWYHVGFTYGGTADGGSGTITAYVNGVSVSSGSAIRQAPYNNGFNLFYGLACSDTTTLSGPAQFMAGKYGMFLAYNRELSSEEVYLNHLAMKNRYSI